MRLFLTDGIVHKIRWLPQVKMEERKYVWGVVEAKEWVSDGVSENNECGEKTGRDFVRPEPITG